MYSEKILEAISPMTAFASSILARHCKALGKAPSEIGADDLPYLAMAIERSVGLFAGRDRGRVAGQRVLRLGGAAHEGRPDLLEPEF